MCVPKKQNGSLFREPFLLLSLDIFSVRFFGITLFNEVLNNQSSHKNKNKAECTQ